MIPPALRRRYHIEEGSQIEWIDTGSGLQVVPVSPDPISALRGSGRGEKLTDKLIEERARDAEREQILPS